MKKTTKYILVAALFGTLSCTNLDENLKSVYTAQPVINNPGVGSRNNVNKPVPSDGLQGAFDKLRDGTAGNTGFFQASELSSDEVVIPQRGGDWFDGGVYIKAHQHDFSSATVSINDAWIHAYNGIFQCNNLLATTLTPAQTGQLKALRAFYYWRLLDMFGNVKIVTTAGGDAPQATRAAVFDFVVSELNAALPNLSTGKQDYARFNQAGAQALLARLYLNAAVYKGIAMNDQAIAAADVVINSGLYSLDASYAKVFAPDNVENKEHIFVVPFDESTGGGMNLAQMTLHYPSQLTYKLAQQPWNGYAAMEDFYNSYDPADKRRANNFIVGPQTDTQGNPILDLAFDKADEDGPAINYTPHINEMFPNASRQSGARMGKFQFKIGQLNDMDNDYPLLRYSEVLLNKAEALFRKNGYGDVTGLALVNQIRARANVPAFATITSDQLLAERGRELFIEALRRTDLIRFGAWGNAWWNKNAHPANDYRVLMAIPLQQIQASAQSANKLTQNPGYQ